MGFSTSDIKPTGYTEISNGDAISKNGSYKVPVVSNPTASVVSKVVTYLKISTGTEYIGDNSGDHYKIKVPVNDDETAFLDITIRTGNPFELYRGENSYSWKLKYEGFGYVRNLGSDAATLNFYAGNTLYYKEFNYPKVNQNQTLNLDDWLAIHANYSNSGATLNMYLKSTTTALKRCCMTSWGFGKAFEASTPAPDSNKTTEYAINTNVSGSDRGTVNLYVFGSGNSTYEREYVINYGATGTAPDQKIHFNIKRWVNPAKVM